MSGWLQIRKENNLVANTHLSGSRVVIGRSPDCDVVLASDSVSRQHAELVAHGDAWSVRDLGSRNGTGVNGVRVNGERPLQPGDVLQIDVFEMLYRSEHSALSRPPQARPKTAVTMMDAAAYGPVRTLHELAPPKIDASHLSKLMAFSGELLSEANLELRQAQLAALMVGKTFNGTAAMLLHVARTDANAEPEILLGPVLPSTGPTTPSHGPASFGPGFGGPGVGPGAGPGTGLPGLGHPGLGAPEPPHISRSVLRAVVAGESAVLASSKRQIGKDMVQMSMAASGLAISAVACPLRSDASHMEILYVMFPGQYGTAEWLALVSLAASLYRQAEAAWIAREAAQTQALLEEELRRASEIQMRLVPEDFTRGDLDVGVGFVPFKGVGGDYVDALPTADGRVLVTVMDVAGKGMDAALIASGLHTAVHMSVRLGLSLIDIVQTLNRHLIDTWFASTSVTVAAAILDPRTGRVEAINCGHPTPLIVTPDGRTRELKCHEEVPLGLMEIELKVGQDRLQSGEMLALYSDGLSELFDEAGQMLGVEGVTRYLAEIRRNLGPRRRASEIATQLHQRLAAFRGKALASDDISFILALAGPPLRMTRESV
ncbi:SpoIIE family protein phosphatase [Nannocystis sp.]|uniref:SpoIIE family protein phosphatase n=1 Tax=Nannocystis sp. TaxID=1962667 RepID=UPI0024247A19|nr:SpoIIE family protein phosphatase [Nannocystis sp.]MBK7824028.1 SpoIIE family protein phosphatase [Nannocystis sp.]MBK9755043.1 SpoIIE family protein phosphatase [Nannocystis sp.]